MKLNVTWNAARAIIESAFSQLKGKFRRLKYLHMYRKDLIPEFICAACMLHYFILQNYPALNENDVGLD